MTAPLVNPIRDRREAKNLSQDAVAAAAGVSYAVFYRIEAGTGKTTQEEIDRVLKALDKMEAGTRKLAGRPFKDPTVQKRVERARKTGKPVSAAIAPPKRQRKSRAKA